MERDRKRRHRDYIEQGPTTIAIHYMEVALLSARAGDSCPLALLIWLSPSMIRVVQTGKSGVRRRRSSRWIAVLRKGLHVTTA